MKIVVLVDKSAGNESVGEMWIETFIFEGTATLQEVVNKIEPDNDILKHTHIGNVRIQLGQEVNKEVQ